jgi:A/G-specific adenine glycosylase
MFGSKITGWYRDNHRPLPWRETSDPYKIWISEVILQQTRVAQGLTYYLNFLDRFPDIKSLADAPEKEVLKIWQGLGYYSRARNIHQAAKQVMEKYRGSFPSNFTDILSLKGIGEYSASAVASIAFNLPYPVMDGNVIRFIARLRGISEPVNTSRGRSFIRAFLEAELDREHPGLFNQAIMEFGALVCTSRFPLCDTCIFENICVARKTGTISEIPLKTKKAVSRERFFHYLVLIVKRDDQILTVLHKRSGKDIWKNLYEFPMIESSCLIEWEEITKKPEWKAIYPDEGFRLMSSPGTLKHILSHRLIHTRYFVIGCDYLPEGYVKTGLDELHLFPVPKLMEKILQRINITFFNLQD